MKQLFRLLIACLAFAVTAAGAAPLSPDPTGYWYNPNESGWGLAIAQQDEVLFATLLVYDEQRRPTWFVASNMRDSGNGVFTGALYRTSGPQFGPTFDPAAVQSETVGTLAVRYAVNSGGQASLRVDYTLNGVTVTKGVVRMTWQTNATHLVGAYFGGANLALAPLPQPSGCAAPPAFFPPGGQIRINMTVPDTIAIIREEGIDLVNLVGGAYQQSGQFGLITGSLFRGPIVSPPRLGDAQVANLVITDDGFVGRLRVTMDNCVYEGPFTGMRR